jgi:hypothetical protein
MKNWIKNWGPLVIGVGTLLTAITNTLNGNGDIASGYYLAFAGWMAVFSND